MERYCKTLISNGENISYGADTALDTLVQLIIDDGVPSRGHRHAIFNPAWRHHGCFTGPHSKIRTMTCQNFAAGVGALGSENPLEKFAKDFMNEPVDWSKVAGVPD